MTASHPTPCGIFTGKRGDLVTQYLGIKYANLQDQLSTPEMITDYGTDPIDATKIGPRAPAMNGCAFEQDILIQCNIGAPPSPPMSGMDCLSLNITVPDFRSHTPLPVMVFIHGGGFIMGANYWPQYDPAHLVKMSVEIDSPVIFVSINYRLGVLGNLTSEELRKAGYPGNNSLRDQRCALRWVKKHIEGFGGDASNVTAFGESAGAVAVMHHLSSTQPLFKRAISMSGTPFMLKPLSTEVTAKSYDAIVAKLGLGKMSSADRIQHLITLAPDELVEKTPMTVPLTPYLDNDFVTTMPTLSGLANDPQFPTWCEELLIGSCQHDGNVFFFIGLASRSANIASALSTSLRAHLPESAAAEVLETYGITLLTPDDEAMTKVLQLGTDIAYALPASSYARAFPGRTWRYTFDQENPWKGMFEGRATHMLDAAFLFQKFNHQLDDGGNQVAEGLAKDFIGFANGKGASWGQYMGGDVYGQAKVSRSYGSCDGEGERGITDAEEQEHGLLKLSEEKKADLDALGRAWDLFVAGK
ncbi:carboxylesteras-like protein [Plenodomus tracheiphilus IPT5]|uniref:Carboxylesteras-like protein n=1 Tax=Plenodomus tracheiphilus IPT5 TaxID=1408161 RepID=A0A6A7B4K7_9PLEO|nr:carboxylesteras-like protein [Plenodomus tracheiphilus IPT5]